MNIDKNHLLNESKEFCMMPWIHMHTTPSGASAPCCIGRSIASTDGMGNAANHSLLELVNSEKMNQLRLDMLSGVRNNECNSCHVQEEHGQKSHRIHMNQQRDHFFDEAVLNTNVDGSLTNFKMREFDMRFSNLCNFKCRTCTQEYSSAWEQENKIHDKLHYRRITRNNNKQLLQEVIDHIPHMEHAYFAGGEPLIMEEHYILLEEMIRQQRTDIQLRYSTNFSNLKFKNKDLLGLWKQFDKHILVFASIDHVGERAEYIRAGTDWGKVEENYIHASAIPNITMSINAVLSVFNYLTFDKFYQHLIDKKMYLPTGFINTVYFMQDPSYLTCHLLPTDDLRNKGKESMRFTVDLMKSNGFDNRHTDPLELSHAWLDSSNTWNNRYDHEITIGEKFKQEILRLDKIRGQDFTKVFPELAVLLDTK
jgi:molybdenum cofactor biosynthesis enzyme MoaA